MLRGEPGRSFVLRAEDLGSLDVGSPVYHRRVRVGRVVGYGMSADGRALDVQVFIESPYENLVTREHALLARERHRSVAECGRA